MVEWLALLIVVPAVVVPVVLLAGFAGCNTFFGLDELPPIHVPGITKAEGKSVSSIELTVYYNLPADGFEVERWTLPERIPTNFPVNMSSAVDTFTKLEGLYYRVVDRELLTATTYFYRVRAINTDGQPSDWSASEPNVSAQTTDFRTTFEWTTDEKMASRDATGWAGYSYVQRIEAGRLTASGENVRLTLRASSAGSASIERVYISRLATGSGSDPYDSAGDLTVVSATATVIPRNDSVTLTAQYSLDETQTLLVSIDFGAAPTEIRVTDPVLVTDAVGYQKPAAADQAPLQDRTGFTESTGIRLIERIEVG